MCYLIHLQWFRCAYVFHTINSQCMYVCLGCSTAQQPKVYCCSVCQPHGRRDSRSQRSGFNNKYTWVFRNCSVKQTGSNTRIRVHINKALLFHPVLRSLCPGDHNGPSFLMCCKVVRVREGGGGKGNSPIYYPPRFPREHFFFTYPRICTFLLLARQRSGWRYGQSTCGILTGENRRIRSKSFT